MCVSVSGGELAEDLAEVVAEGAGVFMADAGRGDADGVGRLRGDGQLGAGGTAEAE